jgi:hypothetical protein
MTPSLLLPDHPRGGRCPQPVCRAALDDVGGERHDHIVAGLEVRRRLLSNRASIARPPAKKAVAIAGTPSKVTLLICRSSRL